MNQESELPKAYDATGEHELYERWEAAGVFKPKEKFDGEKTFSLLMPPPNANGALHVGHGVFVTIEDLMTRYHRMRGDATVWYPGLDHAGFETQVVFEKALEKQGKSRFTMERDEFYAATMEFVTSNKDTILQGLRRLGASADWSRLKFTLDEDVVTQVFDTFIALHEDNLVYRESRPVHWCTKHQTTLSDLEVSDEQRQEPLYYLSYGPVTVATGRPETIFGDVAVAVHPDDERYQQYVGTNIDVDFGIEKRSIPVVADEYVDPAFGTGAVKITPLHDPNDFEIAKRHGLPMDRMAIDQYGKLTDVAGQFAGQKVSEARHAVAAFLAEKGLFAREPDEGYTHAVKVCYKCKRTIEPRVIPQWFVAVSKKGTKTGKSLAPDATKAVADGKVKFVTDRFEKIFNHWMNNIRDWNISRQIVWGIQLPVWYCTQGDSCDPIVVNPIKDSEPTSCPTCGGGLERDSDVFDTWFSSGQWPAIVPKTAGNDDFERFYPTAVMETGWDILFFWVARMIMLGLYMTDDVPFKTVYLHGMVRDKDRQKMSKSKGNVIDPLGVIDQYGADALRMALIFGTAAGNDMPMGEEKIRGMRNFSNKVWNVSRFIQMNLGDVTSVDRPEPQTDADKRILKTLDETIKEVTRNIDEFRFHEAAQGAYQFLWSELADVYVEAAKGQLQNETLADNTRQLLLHVLVTTLKLLHPMIPFVTEAVWQQLPSTARDHEFLAASTWPSSSKEEA